MSNPDSFESILGELEAVLETERQALRVLDKDTIARTAEEKLRLDAALRAAPLPSHTPALKQRIATLHRTARVNQVLLAHARSCVQGMLSLLTGQGPSPIARAGSAPPPPVAVNFRG